MDSFWGNLFRRKDEPDTYALLRRIPLFETLHRREMAAIERIMHRREYHLGEVIFRQGEPGVGMYVVQQGHVEIVYEPAGLLLSEMRDGDFFGEIALLNETPRSATAQAKTACTLWGLFQPDLLDLIERDPRLGVKLLLRLAQIAGHRLIRADEQIQELRDELDLTRTEQKSIPEIHDGAEHSVVD